MNPWIIETVGLLATAIAILGVVANNRRKRICFGLWLVSNGLSLAIHVQAGIWSFALRDLIFLGLAVEGLILWRKTP
jgi:nicotinamide riboside transporter PnuC